MSSWNSGDGRCLLQTNTLFGNEVVVCESKGYRVISVDIPRVWKHQEWIQAFEKFLDTIDVHHIHIYGTSLGGFLAQLFAQHRPRRVKSLILSNSFIETKNFSAAMPWAPIVSWAPSFLLKRYVLTGIRDGPHEPFIADSVDFVVSQVEMLSKEDLASRLTLTVDDASIGPLLLPDSSITVMDTNDYCAIPLQLKDQLNERYSGARRAYLKTGGDFPFLSRPDEVNLHLQLHLRRVGVEARPDLVQVVPRGGNDSGPHEEMDERGGDDDTHKDNNERNESSPSESQIPPAPDSSESHSLKDQLLSNAKACYLVNEMLLSTRGENNVLVVVVAISLWYFEMIYVTCSRLGLMEAGSRHLLPLIPNR
ncbi:maspardin-like isoform X2 [Cucurbita moschata]|uniref:Maspardin n=1 Tax=Cucurbita moschata TaxID=3662 RepID=A0A6J1H4F4_CUCMO|nr:maspardin-like isoform X2 [Cucurbita moschata]